MATEVHRRRNSGAQFSRQRSAALGSPTTTAVHRARLTFEGGGLTRRAAAVLSGLSEETWRKAEKGEHVGPAAWRRIAQTLNVSVRSVRP